MHKEKPDIIISRTLHSLRGAPFPMMKGELVEYARKSGADNGTIDWLGRMTDGAYRNEKEVSDALRRVAE